MAAVSEQLFLGNKAIDRGLYDRATDFSARQN